MGKRLKSVLQIAISLGIGFFLIWYIYQDLTEKDKKNIVESFEQADYTWIALSLVIAVLSHIFRAYRWKYPLDSLGLKVNMANRFTAVMIGYLANLAFPRLGEVTRCGVLARYQRLPFEKLFGTVVAERLVDALILASLVVLSIVLQADILYDAMMERLSPVFEDTTKITLLAVGIIVFLAGAFVGWKFLQRSVNPIALKFRQLVAGLLEGMKALKRMDGQAGFYFHTALIWTSYYMMYYVTFQTFPETQEVPAGGVLASFVLGGLAIVAVQGGLGAYPLAIMWILSLYAIDETRGYAFGWIVWVAQTVMIIVLGFASLIVMPLLNAGREKAQITDAG